LIKQGAKLTATWEDVWEELPPAIQQELESERGPVASENKPSGSLFGDELSPGEKKLLTLLRQDTSIHIDEIVEKLDTQLSSSEIFAVLFELEMNGKIKQLPGKRYVKSF
jgi:DNA processing protein